MKQHHLPLAVLVAGSCGIVVLLPSGCASCSSAPSGREAREDRSAGSQQGRGLRSTPLASPLFSEMAETSGIDFVHFNGMSGEFYFCEMMGAGGALFDYDNDGDLDVFLVQGQMLGRGKSIKGALFPPKGPLPLKGRLYRNDLTINPDGTRTLRFTDVTEESRIDARGYGMGVAAGDYDNDGWLDLYLTNFGDNQMWRNNGDGTFTDVTRRTETNDPRWSVSASFLDFDRDGWLDLYVGNYVDFSLETNKKCFMTFRDYCSPSAYKPVPGRLFHNRRDGTFEDVTAKAQLAREYGPALGAVTADFNKDGWIDLYVANDGQPNQCWMNQGNGRFRNTAMLGGCAVNEHGEAQASMGVGAGDFDNDGDEDLFMTNLRGETNILYINDGTGVFEDATSRAGLALPSHAYTGFGTYFFDFDNDGWLDILTVNGAVTKLEELAQARDPYPLRQRKQLYRNLGDGRFQEISGAAGPAFDLSEVGRGAAFGDVDNDGDMDVLVTNNSGRARLLINNVGSRAHWIGLRLVGQDGKRDMLGAWVGVFPRGGRPLWRRVRSDGSYASASDPRVLVGLGGVREVASVRTWWPSGRVEEWTGPPIDRYTTLREGSGREERGPMHSQHTGR